MDHPEFAPASCAMRHAPRHDTTAETQRMTGVGKPARLRLGGDGQVTRPWQASNDVSSAVAELEGRHDWQESAK